MARRLKSYQFGVRQGRPKYPWKQWTNGEPWELVHGKDFTCTPGSMIVYLYHKATALDMNVQTSWIRSKGKKPDKVVFQFCKRDQSTRKKQLQR